MSTTACTNANADPTGFLQFLNKDARHESGSLLQLELPWVGPH
jgi:hypothetical protein